MSVVLKPCKLILIFFTGECVQIGTHVIMPRVVIVSDFDATIDTQFKGRDADSSGDRIKVYMHDVPLPSLHSDPYQICKI